ncbi:hypothetical protein IC582_006181 [Cucumis melo]
MVMKAQCISSFIFIATFALSRSHLTYQQRIVVSNAFGEQKRVVLCDKAIYRPICRS